MGCDEGTKNGCDNGNKNNTLACAFEKKGKRAKDSRKKKGKKQKLLTTEKIAQPDDTAKKKNGARNHAAQKYCAIFNGITLIVQRSLAFLLIIFGVDPLVSFCISQVAFTFI